MRTCPQSLQKVQFFNSLPELDVDQFLAYPTILLCNCDKTLFVDEDHGHILARNLGIIKSKISSEK